MEKDDSDKTEATENLGIEMNILSLEDDLVEKEKFEIIEEVDIKVVSGIKDTPFWRPTSPDMFESSEEEDVDHPPSGPDRGINQGFTSRSLHISLFLVGLKFKV